MEWQACKKWRQTCQLKSAARISLIKNMHLSPHAANAREDQPRTSVPQLSLRDGAHSIVCCLYGARSKNEHGTYLAQLAISSSWE
jgi:hypothetical protein